MQTYIDTVVIGAGASGVFTAIHHQLNHPQHRVVIIEKSQDILAKVKISGGGRCNVTHACFDPNELCEFYPRGNKELRGPFRRFFTQDTIDWFESRGVKLKVEPDNRMFPVTDNSQTIIDCLLNEIENLGVKIWTKCSVNTIIKEGTLFKIALEDGQEITCKKCVLATGSSRAGYALAKRLGHSIIEPVPSLFTFKINDSALHKLQGLSVRDVEVTLPGKNSQFGPILVTHWGFSGPAIIKLSAWQARFLNQKRYNTPLTIDWLPNYSTPDLKVKLQKHRDSGAKKACVTESLFSELPQRLWRYLVLRAGLSEKQVWKTLQDNMLENLVKQLKSGDFNITGKGVFKEEFVTCGGVNLKEINFKTMESKCCPGLYIVGELLDIDGVTGGFNFQNAWTTGYLAGQ